MLAVPMARSARAAAVRALWLAYPALVVVVVATANHWWFDAFLSGATAAVSARSPRRRCWPRGRTRGRGARQARLAALPLGLPRISTPPIEKPPRGRSAVLGDRPPEAHRVAADPQRDLAHGLPPLRGGRRARLAGPLLLAASRSSSARSATRSTGATRMSGKGTQFGAFLDSTLDRIEEGVVLDRSRLLFSQAATTSPSRPS